MIRFLVVPAFRTGLACIWNCLIASYFYYFVPKLDSSLSPLYVSTVLFLVLLCFLCLYSHYWHSANDWCVILAVLVYNPSRLAFSFLCFCAAFHVATPAMHYYKDECKSNALHLLISVFQVVLTGDRCHFHFQLCARTCFPSSRVFLPCPHERLKELAR